MYQCEFDLVELEKIDQGHKIQQKTKSYANANTNANVIHVTSAHPIRGGGGRVVIKIHTSENYV